MVSKRWVVEVNGVATNYEKIDFEKTHPEPDPDTFFLILSGKQDIPNFATVAIKKDGVLRYYGYKERHEYSIDSNGVHTRVDGRCRKVIVWKKWSERFSDTRTDIKGFFGDVYPEELFKFLLRCPVSDIPDETETWDEYPRQKIGWGLESSDWVCSSNVSAVGSHPDYVKLRLVGFYWRNRGLTTALTDLVPNGVIGSTVWTDFGAVGANCVNTDDGDTTRIYCSGAGYDVNRRSYGYTFTNLTSDIFSIYSAKLFIKVRTNWSLAYQVYLDVEVSNDGGSTWQSLGTEYVYSTSYYTIEKDLYGMGIVKTAQEANNLCVRLNLLKSWYQYCHCTYMYLRVGYSESGGGAQEVGDYFQVDLGGVKDRVTGIIMQSRKSSDQYPRDYKVETAVELDAEWLGNAKDGISGATLATTGDYIIIAGGCSNYTNSTGSTIAITSIRAKVNVGDDDVGKTMYGVVYQETGASPPTNYVRMGVSDPVIVPQSGLFWVEFPFTASVSVTNGLQVYLGVMACGFVDADAWWIACNNDGTENCQTRFYRKALGSCSAPNPFGAGSSTNLDYLLIYAVCDSTAWVEKFNLTDNCAQDAVVSWTPCQARYIKVTITGADATHAWEITQVYIYEADEADYTVLESTLSPNIVLNNANISSYANSNKDCPTIEPLNLPFARLNNNLQAICDASYDEDYAPYEWWIDDATGEIYYASRRGSDKSATIMFYYGVHFSIGSNSVDLKDTVQRVKVVGKGEGKRQDEISSNWQVDSDAIREANTFYEEIVNEKSVADRDTTNAMAKVEREEKKDGVQEVELTIENDTYASGSWDVGDDVYMLHPPLDLDDAYRVKKLHVTVDENGETIIVVVSNAWKDITDILKSMYNQLQQLQFSSTGVEDWTAEGSNQGKVSQDSLENIWEMEKKYESASELVADTTENTYTTIPVDFTVDNGRQAIVAKDELTLYGRNTFGGTLETKCFVNNRITRWDLDPRFLVKVRVAGEFKEDDQVDFMMHNNVGDNYFGFRITFDGVDYSLYAVLDDSGGSEVERKIATISASTLYEFEAKVDWNDRVAFYNVNGVAKAVIPFSDGVTTDMNFYPMYCKLTSSQPNPPVGQAIVEFFVWKSQSKKELETV